MKTSKTSKRRLKKSVRRTCGGVLLASAIMVAAIPFPEAAAYNPTTEVIPPYNVNNTEYVTSTTDYPDLPYDSDTDFTDSSMGGEIKTATTLSQTSDKKYQLDWQFRYWIKNAGADGFITGYNSQYQVDEVWLGSRVYSDYVNLSQADVQKFYESPDEKIDITVHYGEDASKDKPVKGIYALSFEHTLDGTYDPHNADHAWLTKYFQADVEKYNADYENYNLHKDASGNADPQYPEPFPLVRSFADLYKTDDERVAFLCKSIFGDGTNDMKLVDVAMRKYDSSGSPTGWETVYVPQIGTVPENGTQVINGTSYGVDRNGFLCYSFDSIIGIGSNAFKDVKVVKILHMANEVSFIGDSAFEGSFLSEIYLPQDAKIGNRAFYGSKVSIVDIPDGVRRIGAEAFYGCPIIDLVIPNSCTYIGPGAFAESNALKTVTFLDEGPTTQKTVSRLAFYNDLALKSVDFKNAQITDIGEAAFAVNALESGQLNDIVFPASLGKNGSGNVNIGKYCLAGRNNLHNVTLPNGLDGAVDDTIVYNCPNLECFEFGENCYNMTYDSIEDGDTNTHNTMFYTVTNPGFYVRGPKNSGLGSASEPRKCTWAALFDYTATGNTGRHVPYVYRDKDGKDYYEVSDGNYLMVIEKDGGELVSCSFQPTVAAAPIDEFTIPAVVGNTQVSSLKEGCFNGDGVNEGVLDWIVNLILEDGSGIKNIDNNTFNGADRLETAYLGDSIESIGESAFENCPVFDEVTIQKSIKEIGPKAFQNCPNLEDISFVAPGDYNVFPEGNIGENAFNTLGDKLTIHGDIVKGYAPFEWATDAENYANKSKSIRTLYKTPVPSGLSVILDNGNNLATLIDYPHYEYLDKVMYDPSTDSLVELDSAPDSSNPLYTETILYKLEHDQPLNYLEETMVKNCSQLDIPAGVESIDSYGFFNNNSLNPNSIEPYSNTASADAYFGSRSVLPYSSYNNIGLFNGYYGTTVGTDGMMREYEDGNVNEKEAKGNDRIRFVTMEDVVYLPDNAFDDCEGLMTVSLGGKMQEMGDLPFSGCTRLSSVACANDNFVCNNGILYENNPDGTKTIVECLESRGDVVGKNTVSTGNDPDLTQVSKIRERAFENCDGVFAADFTGVNNLEVIPEKCFEGCENLSEIDLPENVNQIDEQAFAHTGDYTKVIVRNKNLYLDDDTNGVPGDKVKTSYYVTYEDALSRKIAKNQQYIIDMTLDHVWTVKYYDMTGTELLGSEQVVNGKNAEGLDPEKIPTVEGYNFVGWNLPLKEITADCFRIAMYEPIPNTTPGTDPNTTPGADPSNTPGTKPGTTPGTTPGGNGDGGNGGNGGNGDNGGGSNSGGNKHKLVVNYGSGSGDYAEGTLVIIEAIDAPAGKVFDKWTVSGSGTPTITSATSKATTLKMPASDCIVTATYKDASSKVSTGSTSRTGNTSTATPSRNTGTVVDIRKPGISNVDKAYASVNGSNDNFIVKITESSEAANLVATALANKYGDMTPIKYFAMDISLYDATGTNKITNTAGMSVNITMPIPDAMAQYAGNNRVGAVNGTTLEDLNCKFVTVDGIPCVSFTANHFSPYTIYVDTNNLTYGTMDSTPKTGDGIHPKWFASISLFCVSMIMFFKKDKVSKKAKVA